MYLCCVSSHLSHLKYLDPEVISQFSSLDLIAKLIVEGFLIGLHKSPYHGFSVEFAEHLPYNRGESLKNIDWRVFGKTNRLYVKRYEEETNLNCYFVLDVSDSMRFPLDGVSKLQYSVYLVAALAYLLLKQRDGVGLILFDEKIETFIEPSSRFSHLLRLLSTLETYLNEKNLYQHRTKFSDVLHQVAIKIRRRSMIVIITDLLAIDEDVEMILKGLHHLIHTRHEVILFNVLDRPYEEAFHLGSRPVRLKDVETGEVLLVDPKLIQEQYQEKVRSYFLQLEQKCRQWGISFVKLNTRLPYDKALMHFLLHRQTFK